MNKWLASLQGKIMTTVCVVIVIIGSITLVAIYSMNSTLNKQADINDHAELKRLATESNAVMESIAKDLQFLLQIPAAKGIIRARETTGNNPDEGARQSAEYMAQTFQAMKKIKPYYRTIKFIFPDGRVVVNVTDTVAITDSKKKMKVIFNRSGLYVSDIHKESSELSVDYALPLKVNNTVKAYVFLSFDLNYLTRRFANQNGKNYYLLTKAGLPLYESTNETLGLNFKKLIVGQD
ncbi:MAG: cache domain-containing protein, partial [Lentisphaeria bacterium]|nr:hypothetical protein [Lentisphaeria bacterium]NQZ71028.1 cache domain-containing protein [Lentisphaeria bacterium]